MSVAPLLFETAVEQTSSAAPRAREVCPVCRAPKLLPRKGWPAVLGCFGCGSNVDAAAKTPICAVEGPAALTHRGVIVPPFVPPTRAAPSSLPAAPPETDE